MSQPEPTSRDIEEIEIGEFRYELIVEQRANDAFSATWICSTCGRQSPATFQSSSLGDAKERARANMVAHHTLMHPSKSGPR